MELYTAEQNNIEKLVKAWIDMPDAEVEALFGDKGTVREDEFLRVARRLRSKGFREISQQERLSILFKDKTRYTINGIGTIKRYCEAEHIQGLPFIAIIKNTDSSTVTAGGKILTQVDIQEYKLRIKSRREIQLPADSPTVREHLDKWRAIEKGFRYIRRWTFQGNGVKFDLSMVRSTEKRENGEFRWAKTYKERELSAPVYEIEVELEHEPFPTKEDAPKAMKSLLQACGEVLRGIQNNTILIRESIKQKVLGGYGELVGTTDFRGANTGTLMLENMTKFRHPNIPNIRDGYNVTDKADGLRVLGYVDRNGELFLIDRGMNVYRPGLGKQELAGSLVDGEWITHDHAGKYINRVLLFDIYHGPGGKDVSQLPFKSDEECRHDYLEDWSSKWLGNGGPHKHISNTPFVVSVKQFFFANAGDNSIFQASDSMLKIKHDYHTDGLIFTKNDAPLPKKANTLFRQQMKWKPPMDNTVDFLLTFEKEPDNQKLDYIVSGIHPDTKENIQYKIGRLFVSSDEDPAKDNPRATILNEEPLPGTRVYDDEQKKPKLKAVLFNPSTYPDTMASIAYMPVYFDTETGESYVRTEKTMEPVRDRSIVEMAYDASRAPGWRWYARNVRADKTSVFQRGILRKTLNFEKVAEDTWKSIHEPVTNYMISTGEEVPSPEEIRVSEAESKNMIKYYESKTNYKDDKKARGMINFHNLVIKEEMLYAPFFRSGHGRPMSLIDLAVGQGGDMNRWMKGNVDFILGVDKASGGILDPKNGAYRRLMDNLVKYGAANFPPMVFINADSSRRLTTGEAGTNQQEVDMLRSIFGNTPEGPIPKYVSNRVAGKLSRGVDGMTCMFALHYFFEKKEYLDGFIENINENLKIGGYFFGANFDGESVFQMLRGIKEGEHRSGTDDTSILWKITKQYDMDTLPEDDSCFGIPITVDFISIGKPHQEFLVNFKYFKSRLQEIGLELLPVAEARTHGIPEGSQLFSKTYDIPDVRKKFHMNETLKNFSFLNRWYIFKRTSQGTGKPSKVVQASSREVLPPMPEALHTGVETFGDRVSASASASAMPYQESAQVEALVEGSYEEAPVRLKNVYALNEIYQFYEGIPKEKGVDNEIVIPYAKRWVSPSAHFPIPDPDPENRSVIYPSIYNYYVAMYYKYALSPKGTNANPAGLAASLFSIEGSIHNEYKQKVQALKIAGTYNEDKNQELILEEFTKVKEQFGEVATNKRKNQFQVDEAKWAAVKDKVLKYAIKYRVERDENLRAILEVIRKRRKILLYYVPKGAFELGGAISATQGNKLVGENKYGRFMMEAFGGFNFD